MTWLTLLLLFKVGFTAIAASFPLLFFSKEKVASTLGIGLDAIPICRLWGVAVTALLVGYAGGIAPAEAGTFPSGVVIMGIVSNIGHTAALLQTGIWQKAKAATMVYGLIALSLILAMLAPAAALTHIW